MSEAITREEWLRRFAARMKDRAALDDQFAMECAEAGAESYEQNERGCGNAIVWENPEDEADEELSCWTDDGD